MSAAATPRRIWLCADDYGISPGVNRAIRDLIERGRLNATSVMMVGPAIEHGEIDALQAAAKTSPRCAIGLHVTLSAPFRPSPCISVRSTATCSWPFQNCCAPD